MIRKRSVALVAAVLVSGAGCASGGEKQPEQRAAPVRQVVGARTVAAAEVADRTVAARLAESLQPFDACDGFLDHLHREASARAGDPQALGWGPVMVAPVPAAAAAPRAPAAAPMPAAAAATPSAPVSRPAAAPKAASAARAPGIPAPASPAGAGAGAFSATNIQEAGVDEPDTVKTDGRRLFAVAGGRLRALDVSGARPAELATLSLPGDATHQLLLAGQNLLLISTGFNRHGPVGVWGSPPRTTLSLIDTSTRGSLFVSETFEIDARVVGARLVGTVARIVTVRPPIGFQPAFPNGPGPEALAAAAEETRRRISASTLVDWLPSYRHQRNAAGSPEVGSGLLVSCDRIARPAEFSGLGTLSVLTFDLADGLGDGNATAILADGDNVYASAESLYVATTHHAAPSVPQPAAVPAPAGVETRIHQFDITGAGRARHVASGPVKGNLLNQFSMSEHDGHLRVATTDGFPGAPGTQSFVTVLRAEGGRLVTTGMVGDLGRGERIYAVRFQGPVGYVVTFRLVDPLYTLDLSDPTRPVTVGELKINGYSAYLHAIGDGLLLGVGQDATETGQRLGSQVSLFDVSDPARPRRLAQHTLGSGQSPVEFDHHAFLWWEPSRLAVVPVQTWEPPAPFSGAVALSVGRTEADGLRPVGRLSHTGEPGVPALGYVPPITRSVVVGERLLTLSDAGLLASGLGDLARRGWLRFS